MCLAVGYRGSLWPNLERSVAVSVCVLTSTLPKMWYRFSTKMVSITGTEGRKGDALKVKRRKTLAAWMFSDVGGIQRQESTRRMVYFVKGPWITVPDMILFHAVVLRVTVGLSTGNDMDGEQWPPARYWAFPEDPTLAPSAYSLWGEGQEKDCCNTVPTRARIQH